MTGPNAEYALAQEAATEVIAKWLMERPGASGRYPHGYRWDAEALIERLSVNQIYFRCEAQIDSSGVES